MSEQTDICVTLAICYLIHNNNPTKVKECAKRLVALEQNNAYFLKQFISLNDMSVVAVMNNILE